MTIEMDGATGLVEAQREFLVFGIGAEEYAVDIALVQELRGYGSVTRLASAPAYMKGVTNLRGVIVPLFDLRIRFGRQAASYDASTVVVVLNVGGQTLGLVVDGVADVVALQAQQLRPPPHLGDSASADYVAAIATLDERLLILVDMPRLLAGLDMDIGTPLPQAA